MEWYIGALKKYAEFSGRSRRKEYWLFMLFNFVISIVLGLIDAATGTLDADTGWGVLSGIYGLAVLIPAIAVTVRRLHDIGRTGWWILVAFIPLIGGLILLVFACLDSKPDNEYGPNPKAIG